LLGVIFLRRLENPFFKTALCCQRFPVSEPIQLDPCHLLPDEGGVHVLEPAAAFVDQKMRLKEVGETKKA
jgi:hypothetical protein